MARRAPDTVGLAGLGTMGLPIARRLLGAGIDLGVWNRSPGPAAALANEGARVAESFETLLRDHDVVLLMLFNEAAADAVLRREGEALGVDVAGKLIVQMGTTALDHSQALRCAITANGGRYVEAPISGSRIPAERGELVAMMAGDAADKAQIGPLFERFTRTVVDCGEVPQALAMKFASNFLLGPLMVGLVDATAFARRAGLDMDLFAEVLLNGQMASPIVSAKLTKLLAEDYSPHAAVNNVIQVADATLEAGQALGLDRSLLRHCRERVIEAIDAGLGAEDMVALEKLLRR
jgi:3-hydroxyisobutyrate dehydrogenase